MNTLPCPLPQVEEALRPYIHGRQETLRIRKLLAQHLQSQIHHLQQQQGAESSSSITPLTLAASPPSLLPENQTPAPPPPPHELTGLRKKYWEAAHAHQLAKHRRDALHSELSELRRDSQLRAAATTVVSAGPDYHASFSTTHHPDGAGANGGGHDIQSYTSLLHQRRRHAKLQILLDALDRIADTEPNPLQRDDLRQWVKDQMGDAPLPPPEIAGGGSSSSSGGGDVPASATGGASAAAVAVAATSEDHQVKDHVLRLKKELLLSKQSLDAETERAAAARRDLPRDAAADMRSVEAQVVALRAARDELIAWIEGELAKMPEGDESVLSGGGGSGTGATPHRQHRDHADRGEAAEPDLPVQAQVEALYDRYVAARASLVTTVEAAAAAARDLSTASTLPLCASQATAASPADEKAAEQKKLPPSVVLPFIPALLQSATDERALVQQTTYLRHRLAQARDDTRTAMRRLASESHLVPADADGGIAWARAAKDAARESDAAVLAQVAAGEANVRGAKAILAELDARREKFAELNGEV